MANLFGFWQLNMLNIYRNISQIYCIFSDIEMGENLLQTYFFRCFSHN